MADYTRHQQKIIRNYYQNREEVAVQRLQELVTELYLTTGKKRAQHWKNLGIHLASLGVPQPAIDQLVAGDDPAAAAALVERVTKGKR